MDNPIPKTARRPQRQGIPLDLGFIARLRQELDAEAVPEEDFDVPWVWDGSPEELDERLSFYVAA